jgi:hypothetical protein
MSFWSGLAKIGGAAGGFMLGGPAGAMAGYSMGSALGGNGGGGGGGSSSPGGDLGTAASTYGQYATQDRNRFLDTLNGGQDALDTSARSAVSSAMPQFQQQLQSLRENSIRRGASNGDLATSFEGDLASATDRNLTNSIAGQAAGMYGQKLGAEGQLAGNSGNTYLDLLAGNRDANQANKNNQTDIYGALIGAAGQLGGAYLGNRGKTTP